jgi:hypothetical protein
VHPACYQNPCRPMAPFCTARSIDPVPLPSIPCTCSPVKFRERLLSASARLETLKFPTLTSALTFSRQRLDHLGRRLPLGTAASLRDQNVTPHVAQNTTRPGGSAIDARTTRHEGYAASLEIRKPGLTDTSTSCLRANNPSKNRVFQQPVRLKR